MDLASDPALKIRRMDRQESIALRYIAYHLGSLI